MCTFAHCVSWQAVRTAPPRRHRDLLRACEMCGNMCTVLLLSRLAGAFTSQPWCSTAPCSSASWSDTRTWWGWRQGRVGYGAAARCAPPLSCACKTVQASSGHPLTWCAVVFVPCCQVQGVMMQFGAMGLVVWSVIEVCVRARLKSDTHTHPPPSRSPLPST